MRGRGPFSLVIHLGRRSGGTFETPIIVAPIEGGFVAELTYGGRINWYRKIVAAGECGLLVEGRRHHVTAIEHLDERTGLAAFTPVQRTFLRPARRHEFRRLRTA